MDRFRLRVGIILILLVNTIFPAIITKTDSILVRENAHIEKLLMLDVTNEAMEADSILVKATDNYICNFPILKLPFFTEDEIDSILLGKADTGHVHDTSDVTGLHDMLAGKSDVSHNHDTSDVNSLSSYLGQKLDIADTSDLARKVHDHTISDVTGLQDALNLKLDVTDTSIFVRDPELNNYYTKTNLSTSGHSSVHAGNITNAPWLTSLPSHNHDTRYLKLTGGTLTGDVTFNASTEYANVTDLGFVAPIKIPEFRTTADNMFVPFLHTTTRVQSGYCKHVSLGSFRTGGTNWNGGIYFAQGGNDNYPTEYFLMEYGGNLKFINSSGTAYKFYNENFKPQWGDIGSKPTEFPPEDHNHSATNITSGTLSNSRLSFNPDYFVQGTDSYRRANYTSTNTLDDNNASGFFRLGTTDPASPDGEWNYYGFRTRADLTRSVELIGRAANNKLWFGGLDDGIRQPWREIWHDGNFNPDYFVQGENSSRTITYSISNPFDGTNNVSTFFRLNSDEPSNPDGSIYYGFRCVNPNDDEYTTEIAGRANAGKLWFGGLYGGTRLPWREIWHSGNLDTANIARRNANNVFTGVNTFDDTVKVARLKPVNSNFIRIDLGQDVKNYGVNFRHIDAPHSEGAIGMYAKSYFDIKSDGLMQLISGEKVCIEGGDSVSISKNVNTIKMLMTTDNKVTIGKVSDTLLPLNYELNDTLMLGRKYGIGVLGFGGTDGLVGGDSPSIWGYSYDFQPAPSLAGNLTYTATKHNFNGDVAIDSNFYALNQGDTLIETGNIGDSAFVNIGKFFTVYLKGAVPGTVLGPYATCGNFAAQGYVTTPLVRNPNGAVIINNIMQCVEGLGVAIGGGLTVGNPTGGLKGPGTINAEAIYDDNVKLTGYVLDKAYNKDFKLSDWDSKEKEHVPARKFNIKADSLLDVNTYSAMLKRDKVLPAFKEMEESGEVESVGSVLQKLWETVETQAVHIAELNERIKMLEKAK